MAKSATIDSMREPETTIDSSDRALLAGDALAEGGDWSAAIETWRSALRSDPAERPAVERRITWFLANADATPRRGSRTVRLVVVAAVATVLATAFVLIPDEPGTRSADLWAVAAWVMIAVAAISVLTAARYSGSEPVERLLNRARDVARTIDTTRDGQSR
jgi:hypothetical protein